MSVRTSLLAGAATAALAASAIAFAPVALDDAGGVTDGKAAVGAVTGNVEAAALADVDCVDGVLPDGGGFAGPYECKGVHLESVLPLGNTGGANGADSWVWTDPETADEYGIMNTGVGTVVVRITDPTTPQSMGIIPTTLPSGSDHGLLWRDVKVLNDHAYVISEVGGHGIQILDLTTLRDLAPDDTRMLDFTEYGDFDGHNLVVSEVSDTLGVVGSDFRPRGAGDDTCRAGLVLFDISDPDAPVPHEGAGGEQACIFGNHDGTNNVHDAHCDLYTGPDADHNGSGPDGMVGTADDTAPDEICITANEDNGLWIIDITDKADIEVLANISSYEAIDYTHQAWFTPDQRWIFFNDELDELPVLNNGSQVRNTRTFWIDAADLDLGELLPVQAEQLVQTYTHDSISIDHNLYTRDNLVFTANYGDGLRVLCWNDELLEPGGGGPVEVAYFDMQPGSDATAFYGAWSAIPYLDSGNVVVSTFDQGMFTLSLDESVSRTDCGV